MIIDWADAQQGAKTEPQAATQFVANHEDLKPADFAEALQEMSDKRRFEVASELQDERLADVLQETARRRPGGDPLRPRRPTAPPTSWRRWTPTTPPTSSAELPTAQAEELLQLMEPEGAEDVRRLLEYDEDTAGGLMTPVPVILPPEATVAEALAHVRREELSPALASSIFIARPPLETPTGRFLGVVHIQQLLRFPPSEPLGNLVDKNLEPVSDQAHISEVARTLATYNLNSLPVVNAGRPAGGGGDC